MSDFVTPPQDVLQLGDDAAALVAHHFGEPLPVYEWCRAHERLDAGRERFETFMALGCVAWSPVLHHATQAVLAERVERALATRTRTIGVYREV